MIQGFSGNGFVSVDNWFSSDEVSALRKILLQRYEDEKFKLAGIGNQFELQKVKSIRNDQIYWLQRTSEVPAEQLFFQRLDDFVKYLNRTCFTGIRSYEFHYAVYEPGSFYKRHVDQFHNDDRRQFSLVMYLTEEWSPGDGGELMMYTGEAHRIEPLSGRVLFFSSEIEHEVLISKVQRLSLTGWLKTN